MSEVTSTTSHQRQYETRQIIYFLRHAVAYHNIPIRSKSKEDGKTITFHHANLCDPKYTDSKLVYPKAHQQARKAGKKLKKELSCINRDDGSKTVTALDCVLVSPLSRCLETAYFVMDELERDEDTSNPTPTPWICKEDLREAHGIHYSDKRSHRTFLEVNSKLIVLF